MIEEMIKDLMVFRFFIIRMESVSVEMPHAWILKLRHTLIVQQLIVQTPGAAANAAEDGKRRKYEALTIRFKFEPVALEAAGVFDKTTEVLLKEIGRCNTGDCRETFWLVQRIGLAV